MPCWLVPLNAADANMAVCTWRKEKKRRKGLAEFLDQKKERKCGLNKKANSSLETTFHVFYLSMKSTASWVIFCVRFSETNGCSTTLWSFMRTQLNVGIIRMNPPNKLTAKTATASRLRVRFLLMLMTPVKDNRTVEAKMMPSVLNGRYLWIWNTVPCPGWQSRRLVKGIPKK